MVNIPKVKALAKQKGMKLKYICTALGYSEVYLNDVARGRTKMSDEKIHSLAAILMTSYEYLTDQTDDPNSNEEWITELAEIGGAKEASYQPVSASDKLKKTIVDSVLSINDEDILKSIATMLEAMRK